MISSKGFRYDIQGLRAIAVIAVIIFHCGFLPNGYLGVDVFLVISGFLITKIIYADFLEDKYTVAVFYERRFRRIIPLVLLTVTVVLILGLLFMLPDDLENLSQSVIATNFFGNNVLQYLTVGDYWDVWNDYKPLLHTWSLGVEEQFYVIFPFLFILLKSNKKYLQPSLVVLTIGSVLLFIFTKNDAFRFYLLPTRFFEIAVGGLAALNIDKIKGNLGISVVSFAVLIFMLFFELGLPTELEIIVTVLASVSLIYFNRSSHFINKLLENKAIVYLGTISFSLYMWHQVILAYFRYTVTQEITVKWLLILLIATFIISVLSYNYVENYLRDKRNITTKKLLIYSIIVFMALNIASFYIYIKAGVIKDVPELEITTKNAVRGLHAKYNARIYDLDQDYKTTDKIKVMVIGNSFARDWANILLESKYANDIEISYSFDYNESKNMQARLNQADVIFLSTFTRDDYKQLEEKYKIDMNKVWITGTKNFGSNNGVVYNNKGGDYCAQRAVVSNFDIVLNKRLNKEWGAKHIDLLAKVQGADGKVIVFTSDCKLISQDTRHLTRAGAEMFSNLLDLKLYLKKKI